MIPDEFAAFDPDSPFGHILHAKKRAFLTAYAETGQKASAAAAAGVDRHVIYTVAWVRDPDFQAGLQLAEAIYADQLEAAARTRAVDGVLEPTGWYKGEPGGYVRKYSDALLSQQLEAALPEKYRKRVEMRGVLGNIDFTRLSDEQVARIAKGEHPLAVLNAAAETATALPPGDPIPDDSADGEPF